MANGSIPPYLAAAAPNPLGNRAPWFKNTAQSYAGIFLWIAFFDQLGGTAAGPAALGMARLSTCLLALVCAGALSMVLFYLVPGLLGMQTGLPLYIVGSSTFGTKGGYFLPGIFMGLLQIGWYSVATYYAAQLVLRGVGQAHLATSPFGTGGQFSAVFALTAVVWGYVFAFLGAKGIDYVARIATCFPLVIIAMLVIGALSAAGSSRADTIPGDGTMTVPGFLLIVQMVIGFFATAGAVGADFCANNRNTRDVWLGGIVGIWLAIALAGGLALITVVGAVGKDPNMTDYTYSAALPVVNPTLGKVMLLLFAIGSMAPACFCSFIIGNSLSTMLGSARTRVPLTLGGATIGIVLAALGVAGNLAPFFALIGASFGPVVGAMIADYWLSGCKWPGPREGVSIPGYAAWVIGFAVGVLNHPWIGVLPGWHTTSIYSLIMGFVVYVVLAKAGLEGRVVDVPHLKAAAS
ncbi:MAG: hypothetical protein A2W31_11770 [Planctomycetes bacterium RBG_16_64_10]|nr:MAG: hypothetical protein A2W31_11770 [Planctomycetes bacterium RBG_16_64_10]